MYWRKFVLVGFSCGKCSTVHSSLCLVWFRWRSPGVEMFIEDHARLRRFVDKVITFMQDCYICRGRYIDAENVKLFVQDK